MAWIRIDDHFDEHPKLSRIGPLGWGYWLAGLAYCNRNLTDGFIPWSKALVLGSFEVIGPDGDFEVLALADAGDADTVQPANLVTVEWLFDLLVKAGLWERVEGGFRIHDYEQYQPSRASVMAEREAAKQRMERVRSGRSDSFARSSPEVRPNTKRSSDNPKPNPKPKTIPPAAVPPLPPAPEPPADDSPSQAQAASVEPPAAKPDQAYDLFAAMCDELSVEPADVTKSEKSRQLGRAKLLAADGATADEIRRQIRWMQQQDWITGGIDMLLIAKFRGRWQLANKPESPPVRLPQARAPAPGYVNPITEWRRQQEAAARASPEPTDALEAAFRIRSEAR